MQNDTIAEIKAGKSWDEIHLLAHKIAIDGLLKLGVLKGDAKEILESRTSAAFFPHGLGHYLGLDTHDVGGNPNRADKDVLFRYLRLRGNLPAGSVVTVEPGVSLLPQSSASRTRQPLTPGYRSTSADSSSSRTSRTRSTASTSTPRFWRSTGRLAV